MGLIIELGAIQSAPVARHSEVNRATTESENIPEQSLAGICRSLLRRRGMALEILESPRDGRISIDRRPKAQHGQSEQREEERGTEKERPSAKINQ